ncbi:hypothetical protein PIB30_080189 [Stylosanthes scabra]|uniref:Uncharacterized protein n=1 Tax=Stylosanthes scabra TaxID=79078 RepID=A0ABU6TQV9_9FABA|nr:hypothetical protein [Stylosanthes scabra]
MRCLEMRPLRLAVLDVCPRMADVGVVGGGRRSGRGGGGVTSSQPHGGASSSHQAGPSQQSEVPATPQHHFDSSTLVFGSPSQDFMVGLNSPGFQRTLQQFMVDDTTYRPGFDGSQVQVHMDLNEPASAPSHLFTAYAGTPTSAYMQDAHFMDQYLIPPQAPEDPLADDACGDEGVAPMERGRRGVGYDLRVLCYYLVLVLGLDSCVY